MTQAQLLHTCSSFAQISTANMSAPANTTPAVTCAQCGARPWRFSYWRNAPYCNKECAHAAGDRSLCHTWDCGCSGFAKKRRLLRAHRVYMRLNDLELGGFDDSPGGMDENSDGEDPEARAKQLVQELRQDAAESLIARQAFVAAVQGALDCHTTTTDLERARADLKRARMRLEDRRQ